MTTEQHTLAFRVPKRHSYEDINAVCSFGGIEATWNAEHRRLTVTVTTAARRDQVERGLNAIGWKIVSRSTMIVANIEVKR